MSAQFLPVAVIAQRSLAGLCHAVRLEGTIHSASHTPVECFTLEQQESKISMASQLAQDTHVSCVQSCYGASFSVYMHGNYAEAPATMPSQFLIVLAAVYGRAVGYTDKIFVV